VSVRFGPFGEEILFLQKLPKTLKNTTSSYWFVDSFFKKNPYFQKMQNVTFLKAGEDLKSVQSLEKNLKILLKYGANRNTTIYCVGGGSLGDSIAFLSSVYMRGVHLVMIPTTWLAAVDSSVGGKTALNFEGAKNILGTFYAPEKIIYSAELIKSSSLNDAEGEIFKTLMLNHRSLWSKKIVKNWNDKELMFSDLERFVSYKTKVVKKDTKDLKGQRAVLNLGHSLGHALELEKTLSHGEAVKQGCLFSLRWSHKKGLLCDKTKNTFEALLNTKILKMPQGKIRKALGKDKKGTSKGMLKFVFLSDRGPVLEEVSIDALVKEYQRQV